MRALLSGPMTPATPRSEAPATDGRTARRDRNREAVLDAVLDLFGEDAASPSPDEVAARSGVSLRSVYRYFDDMETLIRAAMTRHLTRVQPLFEVDGLGEGALDERIERLVMQRLRLFESAGPIMRAALIRSRNNDLIRDRVEETRRFLRQQVDHMFAKELDALGPDGRDTGAALDVLLGFESIEHLRRHRSFSGPAVQRILTTSVAALLAAS